MYCMYQKQCRKGLFCISSKSSMALYSRALQTVAVPGAAGVCERNYTASNKKDNFRADFLIEEYATPPKPWKQEREK